MADWNIYLVFVLLAALLQILVVTASTAEIYCYCNTEACGGASSGYKCRSQLGRCFSKMRYDPQPDDVDNSIHGCADSLAIDERTSCERGDIITRRTNVANSVNDLPILMCCTANMCNYIDQVDPPNVAVDVFTDNFTQKDSRLGQRTNHHFPKQPTLGGGEYYSHQDTWFRAAVVAVPLVGAVILVVLILMALRMLRHDSRRQMKRDASLAKAQLYVADHFFVRPSSPASSPGSVFTQNTVYNGALFTEKLSPNVSNGFVCNSDVEDCSCKQTGCNEQDIEQNEHRMSGTYIVRAGPIQYCCSQNGSHHVSDTNSLILFRTEYETCSAQNHDRIRYSNQLAHCIECSCSQRSECASCKSKVLKSDTSDQNAEESLKDQTSSRIVSSNESISDNCIHNQNDEPLRCYSRSNTPCNTTSTPSDLPCDIQTSSPDQNTELSKEPKVETCDHQIESHDTVCSSSDKEIHESSDNIPSCHEPLLSDTEKS